jgi:hypothetical protein
LSLRRKFRMNKIFVTVTGGCAYVMEDTVPQGFSVEVIDFDNIGAGDSFPSKEALKYCAEHDLYYPPRTLER